VKRLHTTRPAIAMIELIFAIVIMGITLLSAPMLISMASNSAQTTFQQESIAMLASHTNALLSYAWDEQDTASVNNDTILNTDSIIPRLNTRLGGFNRLRILPSPLIARSASPRGQFGPNRDPNEAVLADRDDVDDFDGDVAALSVIDAVADVTDGDFLDQSIRITTAVTYADAQASTLDFASCTGGGCTYSQPFNNHEVPAAAGTRNIKLITTHLTSGNGKDITMHAFMCNIGTAQPRKRIGI